MRRTDSVEILQKLPIVNSYYAYLQEQDLEEFTHDRLKKLAGILDKHSPNLLEGQNKKIHQILTQRSYAHIKNFTNKYQGFKFHANMIENGYHRQIVEGRLNKPNQIPQPQPIFIGVADIDAYEDIVGDHKETSQGQNEKSRNLNEVNHPQNHTENTTNPIITQLQVQVPQIQKQQNNIEISKNQSKPRTRDWNLLSSDEEDYVELKDSSSSGFDQSLKEKAPSKDLKSDASFQVSQIQGGSQEKEKPISVDTSSENSFDLQENDVQAQKRKRQAFDQEIVKGTAKKITDKPIESKAKFVPQVKQNPVNENQDSHDNESYSLDESDSETDEDTINQWASNDRQEPNKPQKTVQKAIENHQDQSIQSFSESDDDQVEDFDDVKNKKVHEQTNKQIHPTLQRFHEECQKNKDATLNQPESKIKELINSLNKKQMARQPNPIKGTDYKNERQLR